MAAKRSWLMLGILTAGAILLSLPASTREGLNYEVNERRLPLGVKGAEFLLRDIEYRRLAAGITRGLTAPEERARRLFDWTRENIRPTPASFPVRDDHITHIIIRGYGEQDQAADVFTTLAAYAGLPAFWSSARVGPGVPGRIRSFVRIGGRWTVWDLAAGTGPEELMEHPEVPSPLPVSGTLRAHKQMPWPRLLFEAKRAWAAMGRKLAVP